MALELRGEHMNSEVFIDIVSSIICKTLSVYLNYSINAEELELIPLLDEQSIASEIRYLAEFLAEEFDYLKTK